MSVRRLLLLLTLSALTVTIACHNGDNNPGPASTAPCDLKSMKVYASNDAGRPDTLTSSYTFTTDANGDKRMTITTLRGDSFVHVNHFQSGRLVKITSLNLRSNPQQLGGEILFTYDASGRPIRYVATSDSTTTTVERQYLSGNKLLSIRRYTGRTVGIDSTLMQLNATGEPVAHYTRKVSGGVKRWWPQFWSTYNVAGQLVSRESPRSDTDSTRNAPSTYTHTSFRMPESLSAFSLTLRMFSSSHESVLPGTNLLFTPNSIITSSTLTNPDWVSWQRQTPISTPEGCPKELTPCVNHSGRISHGKVVFEY